MPSLTDYKWIDNQGREHSGQNHTIESAGPHHAGVYTCVVTVSGFYGDLIGSSSTLVIVQCK